MRYKAKCNESITWRPEVYLVEVSLIDNWVESTSQA